MKLDYRNELNQNQFQAVEYCDGPEMVIAGAGSGKTRVLTYKIAYLLEHGYKPNSIMALTFTNKAANEMRCRIENSLGQGYANKLWMGTFHSVFSKLLRLDAERLGYTSDYVIYDQMDSKNLVKSIVKDLGLDEKIYKPGNIQNRISGAKNRLIFAHDYETNKEFLNYDRLKNTPLIYKIYNLYQERLKQSNAMDFDDLLLNTYLLLKNYDDIRDYYGSLIQYLLVDEYQDTNYVQHCIVWLLAQKHQHVCVVGDDAQSIYSFRGANIDNMLKFGKLFAGTKVVKLEQNYRSTQNIVNVANSLIGHNQEQIRKNVFSENECGDKIMVSQTNSDIMEGETTAGYVTRIHAGCNVDYNQIAVLYRTNAQSRIFEEVFRKRGIPYRVYGSLSFYQRKEIKDVLAYCRLVLNTNDEESLKRVINYPARGIGQTTVTRLLESAYANRTSVWNVMQHITEYGVPLNGATIKKLEQFAGMIELFRKGLEGMSAYDFVKMVCNESGISNDLRQDTSPEGMSRVENVNELLAGIQSAAKDKLEESGQNLTLSEYLGSVALLTDQDTEDDSDQSKVTLMTIHAAKGLEFDAVLVVGLEEGLFPGERSAENNRELEEERRLFYVAITRAKKYLYLLYATQRFEYGTTNFKMPSRFLDELDPAYLMTDRRSAKHALYTAGNTYNDNTFYGDRKPLYSGNSYSQKTAKNFLSVESKQQYFAPRQQSAPSFTERPSVSGKTFAQMSANQLCVGQRVEHDRFGYGVIVSLEGEGDSAKAIINFETMGQKTLLLKFARLSVIK